MTEELKPCPCCGTPEGQNGVWLNIDTHYVACQACGLNSCDFDTDGEAVAAWNRRATPAPAQPEGAQEDEPVAWQSNDDADRYIQAPGRLEKLSRVHPSGLVRALARAAAPKEKPE